MKESNHRDRATYTRLETSEIDAVKSFVEQQAGKLETAELTIRSSAGSYTAELRSTEEPTF